MRNMNIMLNEKSKHDQKWWSVLCSTASDMSRMVPTTAARKAMACVSALRISSKTKFPCTFISTRPEQQQRRRCTDLKPSTLRLRSTSRSCVASVRAISTCLAPSWPKWFRLRLSFTTERFFRSPSQICSTPTSSSPVSVRSSSSMFWLLASTERRTRALELPLPAARKVFMPVERRSRRRMWRLCSRIPMRGSMPPSPK
mmetsp:Transcript_7412/g.25065  ORF Transcript_7412/g.25065 Transcript_7412/m.25065 type:complete len:200 (+) Transcript_7412:159-758(+)